MNILGREFITEQMPTGWVICEKWVDGVLHIVENQFSNKKQAMNELEHLNDYLINECQQLGMSPEQYWQKKEGTLLNYHATN